MMRFPNGTPMQITAGTAIPNSLAFVLDIPKADTIFPICQVRADITITKITATIKGGTSYTFNVEARPAAALNSSGTDVLTGDLTADQNGEMSTSFNLATISAGSFLVLAGSGIDGSVEQVVIEIDYTSTVMTDNFATLTQFETLKKLVVLQMG